MVESGAGVPPAVASSSQARLNLHMINSGDEFIPVLETE